MWPKLAREQLKSTRQGRHGVRLAAVILSPLIVYAIIDSRSSRHHPFGDAIETFIRREDAERFIEEVRGGEPEPGENRATLRGTTAPPPALTEPVPVRQAARKGRNWVPRTLTLLFPDGKREYWLTALVFKVGDKLGRNGKPWVVASVGEPNAAGKHTTVTLQPEDAPSE
jgi:hypothetical protein